ncbi:hypothetical protein F383_16900 [Gossypium arboreum]|uniref:Uncharacterized protein n=1 Tax=Gossypium arboreum TaxID=29729 RepID=A0A0B0NMH6_GOSAR|nr:hypothetical protein F383_16900 [Gossypium arboreum]
MRYKCHDIRITEM